MVWTRVRPKSRHRSGRMRCINRVVARAMSSGMRKEHGAGSTHLSSVLRVAIGAAMLLPASCGQHPSSLGEKSSADRTIVFVGWGAPEERDVMGDALPLFEQSHPGVRVTYTQIPGLGYD